MVEFIGFVISLLALLYLFIKQNHSSQHPVRASQRPPVESKDEEEDLFQELIKGIEKERASREAIRHVPPPTPPKTKKETRAPQTSQSLKDYQLKSQIENRQLKSSIEERHLTSKFTPHEELPRRSTTLTIIHPKSDEKVKLRPSRVQLTIERLNKRQDILIYQEVMSRPKALRNEIL